MQRGNGHSTPGSRIQGFPGGSVAKNSPASVGSVGLIHGQKISWRRQWQPTPVFLPGKPHEQRRPVGYSPWSHKRVRHKLATEQQGQNPGFTPLHDTHQGKWGARGGATVTPSLLWLHSISDQPYLHPWVQSILWGTGSSGRAGLCFSPIIAASLRQVAALELSRALNPRPVVDLLLGRGRKGKAMLCYKRFLHSHFLSCLTFLSTTIKQKRPSRPRLWRNLTDPQRFCL